MPSATEQSDEKKMATDIVAPGAQEPDDFKHQPTSRNDVGGGFFHIYKSGQGYWTRMGTAGGAALIGVLTANFIYVDLRPRIPAFQAHGSYALIAAAIFLVIFALFVFWFTNRSSTADFLIDTDSEMRKVNWTSRKELIGSTKIVIISMFLIAILLFGVDVMFGYVFYYLGILRNKPF